MGTYIRQASHAGSWYSNDPATLTKDLENWLNQASSTSSSSSSVGPQLLSLPENNSSRSMLNNYSSSRNNSSSSLPSSTSSSFSSIRGLIGPHAGYRYAGSTIAYSYKTWLTSLQEPEKNKNLTKLSPPPPSLSLSNNRNNLPRCIFILGPSHHVPVNGFGISGAKEVETPLGTLKVNLSIVNNLLHQPFQLTSTPSSSSPTGTSSSTVGNTIMSSFLPTSKINRTLTNTKYIRLLTQTEDEDEHSIEMHLPILQYILLSLSQQQGKPTNNSEPSINSSDTTTDSSSPAYDGVTIVPILVGTLPSNVTLLNEIENKFLPYFQDSSNFFIWSTDFCHWGERFRYTPIDPEFPVPHVYHGIEKLDKEGIHILEQGGNIDNFQDYLNRTKNTICGRNPLLFLLRMLKVMKKNTQVTNSSNTNPNRSGSSNNDSQEWFIKFLHYNQSSKVTSLQDSSVSYAAGIIYSSSP